MTVSIGILNINTESCLFATSLVDEGNCVSNNRGSSRITWLRTDWKSISKEFIKQCFKKYRFDFGDVSIIHKEIDTKFQELFAQIYSKTTLDEYINFDTDTILSEPAFHPTHVD